MKTIEEMTPAELRELADQKEQEIQSKQSKPFKTALIKEDLYLSPIESGSGVFLNTELPEELELNLLTLNEVNKVIVELVRSFKISLKKDQMVYCFNLGPDEPEVWMDGEDPDKDVSLLEEYFYHEIENEELEEKYLKDIKDV